MKHVHFFGCSITAGDELSDYNRFPWKNENTPIEEYYSKRNEILNFHGQYDDSYVQENKMMAYPAQIEKITDGIKCHNHAGNGAGLGEMIYRLLKLIYTAEQPIDYVFFQLPPPDREIIYNDTGVSSLQLSSFPGTPGNTNQSSYIKYKILSTKSFATTVADLSNLILLKETLTARKIPHSFLDMIGRLKSLAPRSILQDYPEYCWLLDHGIELDNPFFHVQKDYTLGQHYTLETHIRLAEYLKNKYRL